MKGKNGKRKYAHPSDVILATAKHIGKKSSFVKGSDIYNTLNRMERRQKCPAKQ